LDESESVNPARRIFIWRLLKEELVEYNLKNVKNRKKNEKRQLMLGKCISGVNFNSSYYVYFSGERFYI